MFSNRFNLYWVFGFSLIVMLVLSQERIGDEKSNAINVVATQPATQESMTEYYQSAIEFWSSHLSRDPFSVAAAENLASARLSLARATGDEKQYRKVAELLQPIVARRPNVARDAAILLGRARMAQHRFQEASEIAERILAADSVHFEARKLLADALLGVGSYQQGFVEVQKLYNMKADYSSLVRLADVKERLGERDEAIKLFTKALNHYRGPAPEPRAWVLLRMGILHLRVEELVPAEKYFRSALAVSPQYYLALEHLAEVYEIRQQWQEAEEFLSRALTIKRDPSLVLRMSKIQAGLGRAEVASQLSKEAMSALRNAAYDGTDAHVREYAEVLLEQGEAIEAISLLHRDLQLRPGDAKSKALLVEAQELAGI